MKLTEDTYLLKDNIIQGKKKAVIFEMTAFFIKEGINGDCNRFQILNFQICRYDHG